MYFFFSDHYFTTVTWIDNQYALISWLNRAQNKTILTICSAMNGKCKKASGFIIQCKGEHSIQIINVSLFKNFKLNLKTQLFGNLIGVCFKIDFA